MPAAAPFLSIVVPMHDEEAAIPHFLAEIHKALTTVESYELVFVDDGSRDGTRPLIEDAHAADPRIRLISFSRNFGKEAAMTAGLHFARGQVVVPMDIDLQDPPELIPRMIEKWREGFDVVYATRLERPTDSLLKRFSAERFYRIFNRLSDVEIPYNAGDFRLMDRMAVDALRHVPERTRFMKGLFAALGFRQAAVGYVRPDRAAGTTKFRFWRLWNFALEGITSFSSTPLRVWSYVGMIVAMLGFAYGGFMILRTMVFGRDVPGFATLAVLTAILGGLQLLSIGILGEYTARIFVEAKRRPIYIVRDMIGFSPGEVDEQRRTLAGTVVLPHGDRPADRRAQSHPAPPAPQD